ncbi:signal-induced proliferation-associated 1-like protein 3 isoform X2 [Megalops cyprinoides]|uniref:signal-induced proliferation-associated 1-like protein 3 isoform X2 n=1 Tax=Megalops cyprinoides TaxID=118141 RepID=UPI0018640EFB|nr:signal-induced proliferation-associated 1-like protein 3 isoform X2 [Megalops cyprinoides]
MNAYRDRALHGTTRLLEGGGEPPGFFSSPAPPQPPFPEPHPHSGLHVQNGHCAPEPLGPPRASVPKMGVRARSEWPPRREKSRESLLQNGRGGRREGAGERAGLFRRGVALLPRRRCLSKDAEFRRGGLGGSSPSLFRTAAATLQRSSSEVTLSEQDVAEVAGEARAGLYREYGSTSSIDVQAVPEQSFFSMLSQFHQERPDQRSPAPARLGEILCADSTPDARPAPPPQVEEGGTGSVERRSRKKSGGNDSSQTAPSLFRRLRSSARAEVEAGRGEADDARPPEEGKPWQCTKSFAHHDVQSILFDLHEAAAQRAQVTQRRNTATGASAASSAAAARAAARGAAGPAASVAEEPQRGDVPDPSGVGPAGSGEGQLLLSCPHFRNETGGQMERNVSFLRSAAESEGEGLTLCRSNASVAVLEVPPDQQLTRLERLKQHSIEHVDMGARYYRDYFHNKEHSNYFGTDEKLGPVAVSIRREKLEDTKDLKDQYQYRIIFRTTELVTLRGSILEDAVPSTVRHGAARGLPLKEVLECVVPELNTACLRLALSTPKVTEQLLKLDEQGLSQKQKVGILLCRAGQSMEEEMYNNEEATPAFRAFLELLGERVCLQGFTKYAAQLDTKTDSTGTHSLYTTYQGYEVMFHVSTMLPYMPNNPQQLLRKRHIGNDIVTIIFQEPGALPFTPQNIRSQFQHVFVIVRVHNPCSESTCYSVAVTTMQDVPPFGPPIPEGETFHDPEAFCDFLLAKVINAENAAHKSDKFHTMATRTRQEYLRDLAENCVSGTPLDSAGKLNNLISLASKRRERARAREGAELGAAGAVCWRVQARDFGGGGAEVPCVLAVSGEYVVLVDCASKEVVFNCLCADVIGWTPERLALRVYYGRGDHVAISVPEGCAADIREVVQRLKALTVGCETAEMTLRRNGLGQLGFHVRLDGTVAEVEEYGFAWQAGLRQGSRLVEICKVAAVTLSHEQMIDLLRTSVTVKVVIIPPYETGGARRGCTEEYEMKTAEQKPEPVVAGYLTPHRPPAWRRDRPPGSQNEPLPHRPSPMGPHQPLTRTHKSPVPVPYREVQHTFNKRPVSFPENHYNLCPVGGDRVMPFRSPSGSFSTPGSSGPFVQYKPSPDRYDVRQRPLLPYDPHLSLDMTSSGESGFISQDSTMERCKTEPLWHIPGTSRMPTVGGGGGVVQKRFHRQDVPGKDSPSRSVKGEPPYSSHSSSNTLSSNASSSHSDERWFDGAGPGGGAGPIAASELDTDPLSKRGSGDSGIEAATLYTPSPNSRGGNPEYTHAWNSQKPLHGTYSGPPDMGSSSGDMRRTESSRSGPTPTRQNKGACYTPQGFKTSSVDNSHAGRTAAVLPNSSSIRPNSAPKSVYCQRKHSSWQQHEDGGSDSNSSSQQVDVNSKNVFGQPRLRASLRDLRSPRRPQKSTIEDDLKKLIIMDNPETPHREAESPRQSHQLPPRQALHRTFSDESLCSGRRDASFSDGLLYDTLATPNDLLFTNTLPTRRPAHGAQLPNKKGEPVLHLPLAEPGSFLTSFPQPQAPISASELSLTEIRDKVVPLRCIDPGLMPLPDASCGLEWASLVNAAKAYEVQRTVSLYSLSDQGTGADMRQTINAVHAHTPQTSRTPANISSGEVPNDLSGRLYHLEVMLKQLNKDLEKEKQDKVALLAEVANLRENNQRLQEESQSASEQLRNLSQLFNGASTDKK